MTAVNEFVTYLALPDLQGNTLRPSSAVELTYTLCGFANLGIMVRGLTAKVPERKSEGAALGIRSIVAGTLATCMTGVPLPVISYASGLPDLSDIVYVLKFNWCNFPS